MSLTRGDIVSEVGAMLGLDVSSGSEGQTSLRTYADLAGRQVYRSHPWPERITEGYVTTAAPYATGTADFTNASTTVSGTTTVWATTHTGWKMATGYGQPWYRFTRVGNTSGTLGRAYQETTAAASAYVLYQDEFDLAADCDTVMHAALMYQKYGGRLVALPQVALDDTVNVNGSVGLPEKWSLTTPITSGRVRVRVWPIPDAAYAIRYKYLKAWTALSSDSDAFPVSANFDRAWMLATALLAQKISDSRAVTSEREIAAILDMLWREAQQRAPVIFQRATFSDSAVPFYVTASVTPG